MDTRAHVYVKFANPFLVCDQCMASAREWHDPERCGCNEEGWQNQPCGHEACATSACPTWSPVDGCRCVLVFGEATHDLEGDRS